MNRLSKDTQADIIACLAQGNGIRGSAEILGITPKAVLRQVKWMGQAFQGYHNDNVRNLLKVSNIETDETYSIIAGRDQNLSEERKKDRTLGETWTWISLCKDSRLVICWHVGKHDPSDCYTHILDLHSRVPGRVQITTDQLCQYRPVIEEVFGPQADYATVRKSMETPGKTPDNRYEVAEHKETRKVSVFGLPDMSKVSTNKIERQNLTLRMSCGRYARRTNKISQTLEYTQHALAITYMWYNYCRVHQSLRGTPAMEVGLTDHVWEIEELINLVPVRVANRPKTYQRREAA